MKVEETPIESLEDLTKAVLEITKRFQGQVWWRGPGKFDWHLSPSVSRMDGGYEYEYNAIFRFMQRAPSRYQFTPDAGDYFSWLFLMQHHRVPTRLLDWTESPLFACFFLLLRQRRTRRMTELCSRFAHIS